MAPRDLATVFGSREFSRKSGHFVAKAVTGPPTHLSITSAPRMLPMTHLAQSIMTSPLGILKQPSGLTGFRIEINIMIAWKKTYSHREITRIIQQSQRSIVIQCRAKRFQGQYWRKSTRGCGVDAHAKCDALLELKRNFFFRQKALDGYDGISIVFKFSL